MISFDSKITNEAQFRKWFNEIFDVGNKGLNIHPNWYQGVVEAHKEFTKFLGGQTGVWDITTERIKTPLLPKNILEEAEVLIAQLPEYWVEVKAPVFPTLCSGEAKYPKDGKEVKEKLSKNLKQWLKNQKDKYSEIELKSFNDALSSLSTKMAQQAVETRQLQLSISVAPESFCQLGHYYPCKKRGSCFQQGGGHQTNKYILAEHPKSFVLLIGNNIYDKEGFIKGNEEKVLARMWGVADDNFKTWHFSNLYMNGIEHGTVKEVISKTLKENIFKGEKVIEEPFRFATTGVYLNKDGFSFYNEETSKLHQQMCLDKRWGNVLAVYDMPINPELNKCLICQVCQKQKYNCMARHDSYPSNNCCDGCHEAYLKAHPKAEVVRVA